MIKSEPHIYNDLLTWLTEHQFVWPRAVTARRLQSSDQAQEKKRGEEEFVAVVGLCGSADSLKI